MKKKISIIPLDSRPCNTTWLLDLAKIAKVDVKIYPRELCGNLLTGASIDMMYDWLDENIQDTDYLIISSDGLCSGGLVQSRLGLIDINKTIQKLAILKEYKMKYPNLKIYVFDTIMRTTITSLDDETIKYSKKMNEYSRLVGHYYFFNDEKYKLELDQLTSEIPNQIIETFLRGRNVKHLLNKFFIESASDGIIDFLILLQEDSMPNAIQKMEQDKLLNMISYLNVGHKVKFYNGTDEGGAVLLGKVILEQYNLHPKIYLHFPNDHVLNKVMLFEDQPFIENLDHMLETMGFIKTKNLNQADFVLGIYAEEPNVILPINTTEEVLPNKNEEYWQFINRLNEFLNQNKRVAFLDLLFPNGGSIDILKDIEYHKLSSYSAWNTASNALGSCLCEVACIISQPRQKNKKFMYERILDDCLYQYVVRRIVNQEFIAKGYNTNNLGEHTPIVLEKIRSEMKKYDSFVGNFKYQIDLPWNRTFEAEIIIEE